MMEKRQGSFCTVYRRDVWQVMQASFFMLVSILLCLQLWAMNANASERKVQNNITSALLGSFTNGTLPFALTSSEKEVLQHYYHKRYYAPVWVSRWGVKPQAFKALRVLRVASFEGLNPEHYPLVGEEALLEQSKELSPQELGKLDLLISYSVWRYATDMRYGRFNPEPRYVSADVLDKIADAPLRDVKEILQGYQPTNTLYTSLKEALITFSRVEENGGLPTIPHYMMLRKGDNEKEVRDLRRLLVATGDLAQNNNETYFDDTLEAAVKHFQARHGIDADGVVGRFTRDALNTPIAKRIAQIKVNMERVRWLPDQLGDRYILVNIPAFSLKAVNDQGQSMDMRVIVGRPSRETPVMSREISHVVFHPSWGVPPRIAGKDLLPKIQNQPQFLDFSGFDLYNYKDGKAVRVDPDNVDWASMSEAQFRNYTLRQAPGDGNPLGKVKFLMPDSFSVYLHDTPDKRLFAHAERAFSSGCIRVESPKSLANFVLSQQPDWSTPKIFDAFGGKNKTQYVKVQQPPKVHVVYWTAWVDEQGSVHFAEDIYKKDQPLLTAMGQPSLKKHIKIATP